MKKIVVADDHPIVLEGMKLLFNGHADYKMVEPASSISEVESICAKNYPDLLILDINLNGKNSLDSVGRLKNRFRNMKILIFSSYDSPGIVKKAFALGVDGYMFKDAPHTEWMEAIDKMFSGTKYLSKKVSRKNTIKKEDAIMNDEFRLIETLSEREKKIIECVVKGQKEQEIAELLHISKYTVHTHKKNIMRKLSIHSNAEIVKFAFEHHIM